jgi:ABC-type cobalamin transport system permease subunit
LVLALIVMLNQGNGFRSDRLLLTGMAVTALFEPVSSILLANNDPRGQQMLAWISGSTYYMDYTLAIVAGSLAMMMLFVSRLFIRWLEIFPLGDVTALSLGVGTRRARLILLVFVALLTVVSTLIVGPLSFVGLLAPHMARMLGFARAGHQMLAASLLGGGSKPTNDSGPTISVETTVNNATKTNKIRRARLVPTPSDKAVTSPSGKISSQRINRRLTNSIIIARLPATIASV